MNTKKLVRQRRRLFNNMTNLMTMVFIIFVIISFIVSVSRATKKDNVNGSGSSVAQDINETASDETLTTQYQFVVKTTAPEENSTDISSESTSNQDDNNDNNDDNGL